MEWFQVYLLEWLHLVAIGDHCGCGFLVTLGGCRHLDGLHQRWRSGMCWWLFMADSGDLVRGIAPSLAKHRKVALVNCLCHWVTSLVGRFLRCPIVWTRFMQHLLAVKPPSVGRHNGDKHPSKHTNLRRKITCLLPLVFSWWLYWWSYCDWFIPLHGGINVPLTPLLTCKVVVTSSLV
jgi:hypothetical protein